MLCFVCVKRGGAGGELMRECLHGWVRASVYEEEMEKERQMIEMKLCCAFSMRKAGGQSVWISFGFSFVQEHGSSARVSMESVYPHG